MQIDNKEIISEYNEYIRNIEEGCRTIVDYFAKEDLQKALRMILDFSEGIMWIESVTSYLSEQGIQISLDIKKIKEFLIEINEGLEHQDFLLVSDIFEYELVPFFSNDYSLVI